MKTAIADFGRYLREERRVSEHTLRNYLSDLEQFQAFLTSAFGAAARPEDLDTLTLRTYLGYLHQHGISKASVMRKLAALRTFFRFLHREDGRFTDPEGRPFSPRDLVQTLSADPVFHVFVIQERNWLKS